MHTLYDYRHQTVFEAEDGAPGADKQLHGKSGEDLILKFPLGSILHIVEIDRTVELLEEGEKILIFKGGKGGLGNVHFKSSTNQVPQEFTEGRRGEFGTITLCPACSSVMRSHGIHSWSGPPNESCKIKIVLGLILIG
jgi:GTP-binding protein